MRLLNSLAPEGEQTEDGFRYTRKGNAASFGWVRAPDYDSEWIEAWEMPNGSLHAHPKGTGPLTLERVTLKAKT
jgi:hypothetical protein